MFAALPQTFMVRLTPYIQTWPRCASKTDMPNLCTEDTVKPCKYLQCFEKVPFISVNQIVDKIDIPSHVSPKKKKNSK